MTDFTPKININIKSMVTAVLFIAILLVLMMKQRGEFIIFINKKTS